MSTLKNVLEYLQRRIEFERGMHPMTAFYSVEAAELERMENERSQLQDLAIWMTGCGYDFTKHKYYIEQRYLLSVPPLEPVKELEQ